MTAPVDEFLEHYGVKGMKWGVRNDDSGGGRLHGGPIVDASVHSSNKTGALQVAALMNQRYGFEITHIKDLKVNNPTEYRNGTIGFVQFTPGQKGGVIFVKPEDNRKELKDAENTGWFAPGTGNVQAFITHESAHAMFHAEQKVKTGFLGGAKIQGGNIAARDEALKAAAKQAQRDGIPTHLQISKISGYASASGYREEVEAELFSQYHWSPNPPPFIKVWGQTLHQQIGIDPTPFREAVNHG